MATFFRSVVTVQKPGLFIQTMPQDREVDWRICPTCKKEYPWRKDTAKGLVTCRFCAVIETRQTTLALANAGQGTGFGNQGGKR